VATGIWADSSFDATDNERRDPHHEDRAEPALSEAALPLVSIVVPVWNGEDHVRESLDSILGQTYPAIEVIAVDDASTDSTPEILASYGDRIRVLTQSATRGIYGNANDGIALATGDLVGVFHADDTYLPDMVAREVGWLTRHPDAAAVFCCLVFVDRDGREFQRHALPPEVRGSRLLEYPEVLNTLMSRKNSFLMCPTALVRASVYRELGTYRPEEFKNTSDLEMWLRIARRYRIGVLEDQLVRYRRGHGSSSERYHRLRTDQERFFRILDLELDEQGGRRVATRQALRDHEAHRAEDTLMRSVNLYILGRPREARSTLSQMRMRDLAASQSVQRFRLLVLAASMHVLLRLPRSSTVARLFERRWHGAPTVAER
jgi:glycosyltransferase involved in cell wall biosynthesis